MDRRPKTQLKLYRGHSAGDGFALRRSVAFTAVVMAMTFAPGRSALAGQDHCATHDMVAHACCPAGVSPAAVSDPACEARPRDNHSPAATSTAMKARTASADPFGAIPVRSQQVQPCRCESGSGVPAIPAIQAEAPRIGERQRDRTGAQPPATTNSEGNSLVGIRRLVRERSEAAPLHYANQPLYLTQQIFLI